LIPSIVGEKIPESMYFQIVDARIHDMRGKIPNDKRSHGKIYLENTQMAAGFQFKQREKIRNMCTGDSPNAGNSTQICQTPHGTIFIQYVSLFNPINIFIE
jgi:hypothetical protein